MDKLILFPLIISAILLLDRKPKDVFIWVFLPALTLLPTYFDTKLVQGIPELQFWSAALLPILAAWAFKNFEGYQFHWMDGVILSYILVIFFGQWMNGTYKEARKILFNNTMAMLFPYIMIRSFCSDRKTLLKVIWMMTVLGAIVALFNLIEFRMFTNCFNQVIRKIWPRYVVWDTGMVMGRMGFKRAFGPFSHPIIAGYVFSLIAPLAIWSYFQGLYRNKHMGRIIVFLNIMGIFIAISRAPVMTIFSRPYKKKGAGRMAQDARPKNKEMLFKNPTPWAMRLKPCFWARPTQTWKGYIPLY